METTTRRHIWLNTAAILLLFPAVYVIVISLLKYGLGIDGPFDSSAPFLESIGIKDPVGFNINLLILFGPVIALLPAALQVLQMDWHSSKEQFQFNITIRRKWFPLFIIFLSGLILATLFIYLAGENLVIR